MSRKVKLNCCPFCGGDARRYEDTIFCFGVVCKKCGASIKGFASEGAATRSWNKRCGVSLKCAFGDKVYVSTDGNKNNAIPMKITDVYYHRTESVDNMFFSAGNRDREYHFSVEDIGKTVFLRKV